MNFLMTLIATTFLVPAPLLAKSIINNAGQISQEKTVIFNDTQNTDKGKTTFSHEHGIVYFSYSPNHAFYREPEKTDRQKASEMFINNDLPRNQLPGQLPGGGTPSNVSPLTGPNKFLRSPHQNMLVRVN